MSRTVTIDGSDRTSSIRLDTLATVESAYGGEIGVGGCDRDDEALGDVPALKAVTVTESAASPTRMFTGTTGPRNIDRGRLGSVENRRSWDVSLPDLNTYLDDEVLSTNAANRPAETDYARVTWLLTQAAMTDLSITAGVLPNTNTVTMDANDYRSATPRQVLGDCAEAAGKNFFLYNYGTGNLLYYDKHTGTSLSSSSRLTTVAADVDNSVTWAIEDPKIQQDPTRIYSEVVFRYGPADKNLHVTVDNATTESTYRFRAIYVTDESVTTAAAATTVANQYLAAAASEETTLTCAVTLPAANVNDIRAGQRVQIKAAHLNISSYTYYRVTRRKVTGAPGNGGVSDVMYRLELEFAPDVKMTHFGSGKGGKPVAPDCTDCTKRTAILSSGIDQNLSMTERIGGMFVYDGSNLVWYNCGLDLIDGPVTSNADLDVIYHEPIGEAVLAGDRAFYTGTVGPFGDERWSNGSEVVTAAATMDIRAAWTVEEGTDDWIVALGSGAPTLRADGTRIEYISNGAGIDTASMKHEGTGPWSADADFDLVITGIEWSAQHNNVQLSWWVGANESALCEIVYSAGEWTLTVSGDATFNSFNYTGGSALTAATLYSIRWQHTPSGNVSRAKLWASAGAEPGAWTVTRNCSADLAASTDEFFQYFDNTSVAVTSHVGNLAFGGVTYDDFNRTTTSPDVGGPTGGAGTLLRRRDMTDGSLVSEISLTTTVYDIRATPNGQHLMLLEGLNNDGPVERYSRTLTLEDSFSLTNIYVDLADFNVDDAYNVYKMTTAGVLTRYNAAGTSVWSVDLFAVYGYRWPSRLSFGSAFGTGQTIIADSSTGKVKVCGYVGGATWTSGGSYGTVLTLDRADGSLLSQDNQVTTGGNAAAQTMVMARAGTCLWYAGVADGTDFESNTISGVNGWIMKVPY